MENVSCWQCSEDVPRELSILIDDHLQSGVCLKCLKRSGLPTTYAKRILPFVWGAKRSRLHRALMIFLATRNLKK